MRISFSGHETFVCRQFWLKKGYDYIQAGRSFSADDAVMYLGVGKNMTTAVKFWLRSFNVLSEDSSQTSEFGNYLLGGKDPYLEDSASLWLLHYSVIRCERVFIFNAFFNQFLKERAEFTKEQLVLFLKRKTDESGLKYFSDKTYEADSTVFLRTYYRSNDGKSDVEDETANLLTELNLIQPFHRSSLDGRVAQWFRCTRATRNEIPCEVIAFAILDSFGDTSKSISFKDLLEGYNSIGNIFCLTEKGLESHLYELSDQYSNEFNYNETAGNRVLQIRGRMNKWDFLDTYYE